MNLSQFFSKKETKKRSVLIADDVGTIRLIIARVFRQAEFETIEARNGEEVLAMCEKYHPDLIVLDLHMGVKDGISTLHDLHQNEQFQNIPVIVLSGEQNKETIDQVLLMPGVVDYILKDSLENVTTKLEHLLQNI